MKISEKIFERLKIINMSESEFSRRTGISTSTINDWKHKGTNPSADKLTNICKVLDISLSNFLSDEKITESDIPYSFTEKNIINFVERMDIETKKRLAIYLEKTLLINNADSKYKNGQRNVSIVQDIDGNNIVIINDILFKGKRSIEWKEVREYLKKYIGDFYKIADSGDIIYIGADLPKEYSGSVYTKKLKGANAKAKANATQGIPEMIEIAVGKHHKENNEEKHYRDAKKGWYRYDSRFALPVYNDNNEIERYNIFHASMLIRHSHDDKMYLYDIIDIKKETSNSLGS